jgi:hypothetical protein
MQDTTDLMWIEADLRESLPASSAFSLDRCPVFRPILSSAQSVAEMTCGRR